ncbi:MAG: hypothetical protein ACK48B_07475, partial [Dolichospermum sp.]
PLLSLSYLAINNNNSVRGLGSTESEFLQITQFPTTFNFSQLLAIAATSFTNIVSFYQYRVFSSVPPTKM